MLSDKIWSKTKTLFYHFTSQIMNWKIYIYIYIYIYFHIIKMESKDELEKIHIENHTHYYFGDIMRVWDKDIDFSDILLEKSYIKKNTEIF